MRKTLVFNPSRCTGCRYCEVVCSFKNKGVYGYGSALIQVLRDDKNFIYVASFCQHCEDPPCESSCPTQAITKNAKTNAVLIDHEKCIGCGMCITFCPFSVPKIDSERGVAMICNLCDGDPECVKFCASEALQYVSIQKAH